MYASSQEHTQSRSVEDRVSVVMITHNRGEQIRTALDHLLDLPERPPITVVDNASTDGTVDIVRAGRRN